MVTCSTRAGWWVSRVSGGIGMLRLASRSASMDTAWTASPAPTGSRKRVSPPGTKDALAWEPLPATVRVPAMAVTSESINAVSVTLACPATV